MDLFNYNASRMEKRKEQFGFSPQLPVIKVDIMLLLAAGETVSAWPLSASRRRYGGVSRSNLRFHVSISNLVHFAVFGGKFIQFNESDPGPTGIAKHVRARSRRIRFAVGQYFTCERDS